MTISGGVAFAEEQVFDFDIPEQRADDGLILLGKQADATVLFQYDLASQYDANRLQGEYTLPQAVDILLANSGLQAEFGEQGHLYISIDDSQGREEMRQLNDNKNKIKKVGVTGLLAAIFSVGASAQEAPNTEEAEIALDEIVVTGTSIRGVIPESSPLEIYDAVDIRNTGAVTAEGFISTLTQNSNTLTGVGLGASTREANTSETNSADLRGLGVGTTLILLNGRRLAPASGGRTADLSFIPLGAVERVEVLADGASAVYGADAIGGVINFVLKDQQEGAETVIGFGAVDGGREQVRINQSFGFNWKDGNALIALSYLDQNDLDAADRDYSQAAAPRKLVGEEKRTNALASITQRLPGKFSISGDLLHSTRETSNSGLGLNPSQFSERQYDRTQTVMNVGIERPIGETLNAELLVTYADYAFEGEILTIDSGIPRPGPELFEEDSSVLDVTAKLDGELVRLPSGAVRFSLGAGYTEDELDFLTDSTLVFPGSEPTSTALSRDTKYAFAELFVPIISPEQGISGIRRLELSLAARYTDYSDFGEDTSPKIGVLWSPVESLKIRGTFGESFKAPFLVQLVPGGNTLFFPVVLLGAPDLWSTDGSSVMLFADGNGNPELGPEEAQTYSFGFDFDRSGLSISATYYNIDYTDRIARPDPSGGFVVLLNPQDFPSFFDESVTVEQVAQILAAATNFTDFTNGCFCQLDPATVDPAVVQAATTVLFDNRSQNQAISETDGLDLSFSYTMEALGGDLSFGAHATKTFEYEQRAFQDASPITLVDTLLFPADFKARTYIGLQKERWNARLNVNYVDDYENPFDAANPRIDSWTTVDLMYSYEVPTETGGLLGGVRFDLSVVNVLDEDPPFVPPQVVTNTALQFAIGFDPANANPFGRAVDFQISKRW